VLVELVVYVLVWLGGLGVGLGLFGRGFVGWRGGGVVGVMWMWIVHGEM